QDEMYVYVPKHGETETPQMPNDTSTGTEGDSELVRINQATSAELEQLSGIGPGKAEDILNYIEENGPLQSEEDLLEISGIGEKKIGNFKDPSNITLRGWEIYSDEPCFLGTIFYGTSTDHLFKKYMYKIDGWGYYDESKSNYRKWVQW